MHRNGPLPQVPAYSTFLSLLTPLLYSHYFLALSPLSYWSCLNDTVRRTGHHISKWWVPFARVTSLDSAASSGCLLLVLSLSSGTAWKTTSTLTGTTCITIRGTQLFTLGFGDQPINLHHLPHPRRRGHLQPFRTYPMIRGMGFKTRMTATLELLSKPKINHSIFLFQTNHTYNQMLISIPMLSTQISTSIFLRPYLLLLLTQITPIRLPWLICMALMDVSIEISLFRPSSLSALFAPIFL